MGYGCACGQPPESKPDKAAVIAGAVFGAVWMMLIIGPRYYFGNFDWIQLMFFALVPLGAGLGYLFDTKVVTVTGIVMSIYLAALAIVFNWQQIFHWKLF